MCSRDMANCTSQVFSVLAEAPPRPSVCAASGDYEISKAVVLHTPWNVHVRSALMNISYSLISHYFWC